MILTKEQLYSTLPAIYRIRDAKQGEQLRALLAIIESEFHLIEGDVSNLYENWFVETADQWILPYLGDLLGVQWLHDIYSEEWPHRSFNLRGYVANTMAYRRRKGTVAVLEQLARDVTGWDAHAVEFFQLLGTTQHLNHLRPQNLRTPDIRDIFELDTLDGPFEQIAHTADIRNISQYNGKYNIPNIGLFLWRLENYLIEQGTAFPVATPPDGRYTFNPLGLDIPLFNRTRTEPDISHLAEEINVQAPLRRLALFRELDELRQALVDGKELDLAYFSERRPVVQIQVEGEADPIPPREILICDLSDWRDPPTSINYTKADGSIVPSPIRVAVDPRLGRIAFPSSAAPGATLEIFVYYCYGFSSDIGGGPYDRRYHSVSEDTDVGQPSDSVAYPDAYDDFIQVSKTAALAPHQTINSALGAWVPATNEKTVIQVEDSRTYNENLVINLSGTAELIIQAENGQRPVILGNLTVVGTSEDQKLSLNGLIIAGRVEVQGNLGGLSLEHCTLVPGLGLNTSGQLIDTDEAKLIAPATSNRLQISLARSIVGPLNVSPEIVGLRVEDSIIDAGYSRYKPALISGSLSPFPPLSGTNLKVEVTIGKLGPVLAEMPNAPTSLTQARNFLQQAIQSAHSNPAFSQARVLSHNNRLIVLPGLPQRFSIRAATGDTTADDLRLTTVPGGSGAKSVTALVGANIPSSITLTSDNPTLKVRIGSAGPHFIGLTPNPAHTYTRSGVRGELHTKIRNADPADAFAEVMVLIDNGKLVVLPGGEGIQPIIEVVPDDKTTLAELALESHPPAIASGITNALPGPEVNLKRTTILGRVSVKAMELASECLFAGLVTVQRLQGDSCVRFSYVPVGSHTPQRFRCQPDLALKAAPTAAEKERVRVRLVPAFTSTDYGHPAYAQLSLTCAKEIRTGAEDGSEMGVFSHLRQPQREANLRATLDEYLRFGLNAGIIYVT